MNVPRNYSLLRAIASALKVLAWVALAVGVVGAIIALAAGLPGLFKLIGLVASLLTGIVWFVQLYAFGSILALLMDIEEHTHLLAHPTA